MNPKVVFRCFFISILLAAPTPLLLAGIVHLTNAPLAEQWLAEAAFSVYAAVALGCFAMLFVGTLAAAALAPPMVVKADVARVKPATRQPQAAPVVDDEEEDIIDPNDGREEGEVKWFNTNKGYGFITPEAGGPDVFVHISAVERAGLRELLDQAPVARQHPRVVDPDPAPQEGREGLAEPGGEPVPRDALGDRVLLLPGEEGVLLEARGVLGRGGLRRVDDVDRRLPGVQQLLDRLVHRRRRVVVVQRHRALGVGDQRGRPPGAAGEVLAQGRDVAEGRAHQHPRRLRRVQKKQRKKSHMTTMTLIKILCVTPEQKALKNWRMTRGFDNDRERYTKPFG